MLGWSFADLSPCVSRHMQPGKQAIKMLSGRTRDMTCIAYDWPRWIGIYKSTKMQAVNAYVALCTQLRTN